MTTKTTENHQPVSIDTIIALCKSRGIVFPGSDIYDGLANTWDYGPLGVELKNHIKSLWWREFVTANENSVGLDGGILMNRNVWVASGHVSGGHRGRSGCLHLEQARGLGADHYRCLSGHHLKGERAGVRILLLHHDSLHSYSTDLTIIC